jgi:hypothetical protein
MTLTIDGSDSLDIRTAVDADVSGIGAVEIALSSIQDAVMRRIRRPWPAVDQDGEPILPRVFRDGNELIVEFGCDHPIQVGRVDLSSMFPDERERGMFAD